jgi:transposase-like protein
MQTYSAKQRTPELDGQIVSLYRAGATLMQVAAQTGQHFTRVFRRLHTLGIPMRPPGRPSTRHCPDVVSRDLRIADRYRHGEKVSAIVEQEGVAEQTVYNALRIQHVEARQPWASPQVQLDICNAYLRGNESQVAIGNRFGLSQSAVSYMLRRHGVPARPRHMRYA